MIYVIIILGLILRLFLINQSLWLDEATSILVARNFSINEILNKFSPGDFHPPGYYIALKLWGGISGFSEFGVRSLSVIAGIITIFILYKLVILVTKNQHRALLASAILATNPLHIYYSQEARMYSMATLLAVIDVYLIQKFHSSQKKIYLVLFSIFVSLSLYTYYPLIFLVITLLIHSLIVRKNQVYVAISILIGLLTFLPWINTFTTQIKLAASAKNNIPNWWNVLGKTSFRQIILVWVKFIIGRISFYTKKGYIAYVVVISIVPFIALLKSWFNKKQLVLFWGWLIVPTLGLSVMGLLGSGFSYFRLLFILPVFCVLLACGIVTFSKSWVRFATFVVIISQLTSLVIFWIKPRHHRENWRDLSSYIESNSNLDSVVVFENIGQADPLKYYTDNVKILSRQDFDPTNLSHIWLMRYAQPIFDPQDALKNDIEKSGFEKIREKDFNGVTVWEYKKS